ncbi:septum formation protein Maf [bacterium]|jgi:MAF protein|nr:septum formation protein Maf [bacterium]NBW56253.1 septum formation protein Maf [bacterium]NBX72355.1 septum formation protein Maf [bacterium]
MQLILGSSSPSRKKVLNQLNLMFTCISPDIDETQLEYESVQDYVKRLSEEKARAVLKKTPINTEAIIIACDQVAHCKGKIYGKPENKERATIFLNQLSGQSVEYICSITLLNTKTLNVVSDYSRTHVVFKQLSSDFINKYVKQESILECASGLQIESMGPLLLENFQTDDPTSIFGLPVLLLDHLMTKHQLNLIDFCL